MTTMTGSLFVRALDSDTTAFSVDQAGSVVVGGDLTVSGAQAFTGGLTALASSAFVTASFSAINALTPTVFANAVTTTPSSAQIAALFTGGLLTLMHFTVNGTSLSVPLFRGANQLTY